MIVLRSTGSAKMLPSRTWALYSSIVSGSFYVAYLLEDFKLEISGELGSFSKICT